MDDNESMTTNLIGIGIGIASVLSVHRERIYFQRFREITGIAMEVMELLSLTLMMTLMQLKQRTLWGTLWS